ncbi:UDP-glucose 4-epimerase GalE [Vogesella indigofera]|uniref:UDP-glucose 4-epimerase GalE n=1 Tax=Vogesella indigofera TaxID=45465 RepID=UPI00234D4303|nr:UDP-glucose 4-epimerase GalE [Vogesella indigofera]MDC7704769.1 UDP-glucose 4-epimerase GalE [Vogesella indigofera]
MILVTGGAGYIGSHICVQLLQAGHEVLVLDNFSNSKPEALRRVECIAGKKIHLLEGDIRDSTILDRALSHPVRAVIHLAGLKAVGESVNKPVDYYSVNVTGTLNLIQAMQRHQVYQLVFSSSATVYGTPETVPIKEDTPLHPESPYGRSKWMAEQILHDLSLSVANWKIVVLRYFNPVGAHPSGLIGEDPSGVPNNLMPYISQVASGKRPLLQIYGNDYPTPDGTGIRDYIHVEDLAAGHLAALTALKHSNELLTINLGTGHGHSVMEVLNAYESACGSKLSYQISARRPGDVAFYWADPSQATKILGWTARKDLQSMCNDSWRWQKLNPNGFC